ncbi:MAG: NB-ARC domain-containing protein, partial [Dolichospermum sp.]
MVHFFGRSTELHEVEELVISCQLVAILGMGGIGKTAFCVKRAQNIQEKFDYIILRQLLTSPPLKQLLVDLIKFLSNQQDVNLPNSVDQLLSKLLDYLRESRCLVIIDNFEGVLQGKNYAGQYQKDREDYGDLLRQVSEVKHKSCLMVTSREKPKEVSTLETITGPIRSLLLTGLNVSDVKNIFAQELCSFSASQDEWEELVQFYNGNPFFLKLVSKYIKDVFFGKISDFLREKNLRETNMNKFLRWHFNRLTDKEKEVVYWLAIHREPVSFLELKEDLLSLNSKNQLGNTLQSLQRRFPLERTEKAERFSLHPIFIDYITEQLIIKVKKEIINGKINILKTYGLLNVLTKEYVIDNQCRLILKPIEEIITEPKALGSKIRFEQRLIQILSMLQKESPLQPGYAAGNIFNLLCHLKENYFCSSRTTLRGYDFSHLTIWQVSFKKVNLYDVNFSYSKIAKSTFTQFFGSIFSVAFSPDGGLLAIGDTKAEIHVFRVRDSEKLFVCKGHIHRVWSVTFSPDSQMLASGSGDHTVKIWDVRNGQCLKTLEGHTNWVQSVAFSPD